MIAYAETYREGVSLTSGITGKLYKDKINVEVSNAIAPSRSGKYAVLTMTGAQAKELARTGFDVLGDGNPYPYVLATRGGGELEDGRTYQAAFLMRNYTEEAAQAYSAQVYNGSIRDFLRDWLTKQKTVSPGGNPWE